MGKENNVLNRYLSVKYRFADLINATVYGGRRVLDAEHLTEISGTTYEVLEMADASKIPKRRERRNDIAMRHDDGRVYRIFLEENQASVSYNLPLRDMDYLLSGYRKQYEKIKAEHLKKGDLQTFSEKASGMGKNDRLMPIHLLWIYHGEEEWDGPRKLSDIMDFGQSGMVDAGFTDIAPHLVCLNELREFSSFHTEVRELFQALHYSKDKVGLKRLFETEKKFSHLDADTMEAISVLMHVPSLWKNRRRYMIIEEEKEGYDMCTALKDWEAEIREEMSEQIEDANRKAADANRKAEDANRKAEDANQLANRYRELLIANGIDPEGR